jgi:hypothetical protein
MNTNDINKEYDKMIESADKISNKLTEENVEDINKIMEDNAENNPDIKLVQSLPSNNNVEDSDNSEKGFVKKANVITDPNTGEQKIISTDDDIDNTTFEDLVKEVEEGKEEILTHDSIIKLWDEEFLFKIR